MNNQSTALEGGAMPSAHKFNPLTTDAGRVRHLRVAPLTPKITKSHNHRGWG